MTEHENIETVGFRAGYDDATLRRGHLGLQLLMLADTSDRELSDYWEGWHPGNATTESSTKKSGRRK